MGRSIVRRTDKGGEFTMSVFSCPTPHYARLVALLPSPTYSSPLYSVNQKGKNFVCTRAIENLDDAMASVHLVYDVVGEVLPFSGSFLLSPRSLSFCDWL
jgi:hypothetical protein